MLNVLHIIYGADMGGISSFILNYYKNLDRSRIHFDFAVEEDHIGYNGKILEKMGCRFYFLPPKFKICRYYKCLGDILHQRNYDIVHSHIGFSSYYPLGLAKLTGVKHTIAHAHGKLIISCTIANMGRELLSKYLTPICTEQYFCCSKDAAVSTFGKKWGNKAHIIKNAIETKKYQFSKDVRSRVRKELHLSPRDYVIGIIARLSEEKNVEFAIDVLCSVVEKKEAILLIVGGGPLFEPLKMKSATRGVVDKTIFLGWRSDVEDLLCAMDIVLLPSKHEGFGMAALEALASGMHVLVSNAVPMDLGFSDRVKYLPVGKEYISEWVNEIFIDMERPRCGECDEIYENGYDIVIAAKRLEEIYFAISENSNVDTKC